MADIRTLLAQILGARYGRDVRQSIHDAIEQCYEDGRAGAIDLQARNDIDALDTRVGTAEGNITSLQGDITDLQRGKVTDLGLITVPGTVTTISDAIKNAIEQVLSSTESNKSYVARMFWTGNDNFNLYFTNLGDAINFELTASTAMYFGRYVFSSSSISALNKVQTKDYESLTRPQSWGITFYFDRENKTVCVTANDTLTASLSSYPSGTVIATLTDTFKPKRNTRIPCNGLTNMWIEVKTDSKVYLVTKSTIVSGTEVVICGLYMTE